MSNNLLALLNHWYPKRDSCGWVLGVVYQTQGSAYRKPGAFMLFDDTGGQFGLLSGGCLESDLHRKAMAVLASGTPRTVRYDSSDEDETTARLGLGCGGVVDILLQPLSEATQYLSLPSLLERLRARQASEFWQSIPSANDAAPALADVAELVACAEPVEAIASRGVRRSASLKTKNGQQYLCTVVTPEPHLLVVGGGIDARPLLRIAHELGWETTLLDPRPANARAEHFANVSRISRAQPDVMTEQDWFASVDAVVIMTHSKPLDAAALRALQSTPLSYCAMIGPPHRQDEVTAQAGVNRDRLPFHVYGPAGLDIGGERPESIALSILSQCHAVLYGKPGQDVADNWPRNDA